ncbi:MAG: hypothetical protein ACLGXA_08020 [Acidobacteriota bacterium]
MTFATKIGPLPYYFRIASAMPNASGYLAQLEFTDASGVVHAVPDENGNPQATLPVQIYEIGLDTFSLIRSLAQACLVKTWLAEAGSAPAAFGSLIAQNYREQL